MRHACFLVFVLFTGFTKIHGIESFILENKIESLNLSYIEFYEDISKSYDIKKILSNDINNQFSKTIKKIPHFGITSSAYWLRFELNNLSDRDHWLLEVNHHGLEYLDFFIVKDNNVIYQVKTGLQFPFNEKKFQSRTFVFDYTHKKNEIQQIYIRTEGSFPLRVPIVVYSKENFILKSNKESFLFGSYFGLVIIMLFYNIFLFLRLKDKAYLYYVLFIFFSYLIVHLFISGHFFQFFQFFSFDTSAIIFILCWLLGILSAALFATNFLQMQEKHPSYYKYIKTIIYIVSTAIPVTMLLPIRYGLVLCIAISMVSFSSFFIISLLAYLKKNKSARFFLIAWSALIVATILADLRALGIVPSSFFFDNVVFFGNALDLLLLSIALGDRIQVLSVEKEKAAEMTQIGVYYWDLTKGDEIIWSDEMYKIHGLDKNIRISSQNSEAVVHPDDREMHQRVAENFLKGNTIPALEYRIIRANDGAIRYLYTRGKLIVDENNKPVKIFGTAQDVTEIRESEHIMKLSLDLSEKIQTIIEEKDEVARDLVSQRLKFAREIHDNAGAELTELLVYLEDKREDSNVIRNVYQRISQALGRIRDMVFLLKTSKDYNLDIDKEIELYIERIELSKKYEIKKEIDQIGSYLNSKMSLHVFRIFQEWMTNVFRHAKPEKINFHLKKKGVFVFLSISNDGKNFFWTEEDEKKGMGLINIKERMKIIGAKLRYFRNINNHSIFILRVKALDE
ncbi:MAG: PAS domain-containing protein [Spirochaetia bacterium]|nr:PAS domain-containing protein [Spirochaetia bacterium]